MNEFEWLGKLLGEFRERAQELRDRLRLFEGGDFRMTVNNQDVTAQTMKDIQVNIDELDSLIGQIEVKLAGK